MRPLQGGVVNTQTGMGILGTDKSEATWIQPTRYLSKYILETMYVESWATKKFIRIPVDDMALRWRQWMGEDESAVDAMIYAEKVHKVRTRLARAMRCGRLFGTGILAMLTAEADITEPLDVTRLREGDLRNLLPFDRYSLAVDEMDEDPMSPTYGEPVMYRINPNTGHSFEIHPSRCLRFDGIEPLGADGFTVYQQEWGLSELIPVALSIVQDLSVAAGVAHLSNEASVAVVKMDGFAEVFGADETGSAQDRMGPEEYATRMTQLRSIYKTTFIDAEDEFMRVAVNMSGFPQLMDKFHERLAAAADIPESRFMGRASRGMNATGEGDANNYSQMVHSMQTSMLTDPLTILDEVLARTTGQMEAPEYRWLPFRDLTEKEQVDIAKGKVEAVKGAVIESIMDESEARAALDKDPILGSLDPMDIPEPREPRMGGEFDDQVVEEEPELGE